MSLPKEYFSNKYHINDMEMLNEELEDNIRYLEDTIKLKERAVGAIEYYKAFKDSIKAMRSVIQLLNDLSFISYHHYINDINDINDMDKLNQEIQFILMHLEDTTE